MGDVMFTGSHVRMTDARIRAVFRRILGVRRRDALPIDYHSVVLCVSDLSSEPYQRVFDLCLEEE